MEFSWSALWNITDETPNNCEMFLNYSGMKLFLECLKVCRISSAISFMNYRNRIITFKCLSLGVTSVGELLVCSGPVYRLLFGA